MKYVDDITNSVIEVRRYNPMTLEQVEHAITCYTGMNKEETIGYKALCQLSDLMKSLKAK